MALYARATSNFIVLNRVNSKLISTNIKSTITANFHSKFIFHQHSICNVGFLHTDSSQRSKKKEFLTFDNFLEKRREEAKRSILVRLRHENDSLDFTNYCSTLGEISRMYNYSLKNKSHFLVEFKDLESVNEIMKTVVQAKSCDTIPVKSLLLSYNKLSLRIEKTSKPKIHVKYHRRNPTEGLIFETMNQSGSVSNQLDVCYSLLNLDELGKRLRFHTAFQIENSFTGLFPKIQVLPFGSTVNGFGRTGCDLDLYVNFCGQSKNKGRGKLVLHGKSFLFEDKVQCNAHFLQIIGDTLETFVPGVTNVIKILHARVPIVKFKNEFTGVDCDLSLSNMSAVYMSELLYLYGEIDERVRNIVFTIHYWAKICGITVNQPGKYLTNFSLTLIIIFYLQLKRVVPTLQEMKERALYTDRRVTDTKLDCTFMRNVSLIRNQSPCTEDSFSLFQGFFDFYANFDFKKHEINLVEGYVLRKRDNSPLYICNPLEPTLNVSRNVTRDEMRYIQKNISQAARKLEISPVKPNVPNWGILPLFEDFEQDRTTKYRSPNSSDVRNGKNSEVKMQNLVSVSK